MTMQTKRKAVESTVLANTTRGPILLLMVKYVDGRQSWGVSFNGVCSLFGQNKAWAMKYAARMEQDNA
jgi:hypothetical protein